MHTNANIGHNLGGVFKTDQTESVIEEKGMLICVRCRAC